MGTSDRATQFARPLALWLILIAAAMLTTAGCGADMNDAGASMNGEFPDDDPNAQASQADELSYAEQKLSEHRVDEARAHYAAMLDREPGHGAAAAGMAITDILLLFEMSEVTELFIENLGASSGFDANEVIYAEGGYLYWASRGARWNDDGQYGGIHSLLADDLPWSSERLRSLISFVDGLDEPTGKLIRQLVTVANALRGIDHNLEVAIEDSNFNRLYVPGQVFYDSDLTLRLGRSELSVLRSLIAATRSAIYFVAAYENQWSLETAFGEWRFDVSLEDPNYVAGFGPVDYTMTYLDQHLFRSISNPERLSASRSALRDALTYARDALRFGVEQNYATTLEWSDVDEDIAFQLDGLLEALSEALDGPVTLPYSDPAQTTLDLSPLFEDDGLVLDDEIPWFRPATEAEAAEVDADQSLDDMTTLWALNDDALHAFWTDPLLDIPGDSQEVTLHLSSNDGDLSTLSDTLFGAYRARIDDVYFATR